MIKKSSLLLASIFAYWAVLYTPDVAADSDLPHCAGSTGAAYGLCLAATHLGCGTEAETNPQACSRIEENYLRITGSMPTWLVTCPCFDSELIQQQGEITQCEIQTSAIPDGGSFAWNGGFGCTGTACTGGNELSCGIGPIGLDLIIVSPITPEENETCLAQIIGACADAGF